MVRFGTFNSMISLSSTNPIKPPLYASGVICPTTNPCVPPLNLPSVINATDFPKPAPIIAEVGFNISGIPGAPTGPTFLMTTTSPGCIFLELIPSINACSPSNTLAGPSNISPSFPEIFATLPPVAKLPYIICKWPVGLTGFSFGRIIFC